MYFFTPDKIAKIEKCLKDLSDINAQLEKYKRNDLPSNYSILNEDTTDDQLLNL